MTVILRWLISIFIAIAAITLAVANRESAMFIWSPFHEPVEAPLYALFLGFALAGFIFGGLLVWLNSVPVRLDRRRKAKKIEDLEETIQELRDEISTLSAETAESSYETSEQKKGLTKYLSSPWHH